MPENRLLNTDPAVVVVVAVASVDDPNTDETSDANGLDAMLLGDENVSSVVVETTVVGSSVVVVLVVLEMNFFSLRSIVLDSIVVDVGAYVLVVVLAVVVGVVYRLYLDDCVVVLVLGVASVEVDKISVTVRAVVIIILDRIPPGCW